jgi:hypothetical protein
LSEGCIHAELSDMAISVLQKIVMTVFDCST